MGNTYELIKKSEDDILFLHLLKKGLIPISVLDKKVYYERFLKERGFNSKAQAITNTAEEYNVSERTIRRAIAFMKNWLSL